MYGALQNSSAAITLHCILHLTLCQSVADMAMHDLVPLEQPLLPGNLATAFGLEQPETDAKAEAKPPPQTLQASGNAGPPAWAGPGGFMAMAGGMPQAAPALQPTQMPPMAYDQQLNSTGMGLQQPFYGRPAQQGAPQTNPAAPRSSGAAGPPPRTATAGRADAKDNAGVSMTKKPRVAWTADLHKRFVDAVTELGVHTAVPKAIMQVGRHSGPKRRHVLLLDHHF